MYFILFIHLGYVLIQHAMGNQSNLTFSFIIFFISYSLTVAQALNDLIDAIIGISEGQVFPSLIIAVVICK